MENKSNIKNNIAFISVLRVLAALAVVIIHTRSVTFHETNAYNFVHACMLWSVPVFFMITGYIFVGIKKITDYSSVKNNIFKFLIILFTLGFFYAICQRFFETKSITTMLFVNSFFDVLKGNLFDHMWYVYAAIGIYLILPVLSSFVNYNKKSLYILLALTGFFGIVVNDICSLLNVTTKFNLPLGNYSFYILAGAAIKDIPLDKLKTLYKISWAIVPLYMLYYAYIIFANGLFLASYVSIPVALMSLSVFIICAYLFKNTSTNKFTDSIAKCTWGIYLLHPFFIHVVVKLFKFTITPYNQFIAFPLACIFIFTVSHIATLILKKIPIIKKFI